MSLDEPNEPEQQKLGLPKGRNFGSKPVVCATCHSLRYYGRVKDVTVENLLPDFDFDHTIGRKLVSTSGARLVVLMVVDAADFDGSFPRKVAKLVSDTIDENSVDWKQGKSGNVPRVFLVVTKIDLLPPSLSPTRLEHWIRTRAREGGSNKVTSVHLVSAVRGWGLKHLVDDVCKLAGTRGNVWAVGAQNAGKSTFDRTFASSPAYDKIDEGRTEIGSNKLGVETKNFQNQGRKAGYTVHIAGLMRLDVEETSVDTPPTNEERVQELGNWVRREFHVSGNSWDVSSIDVSASGVGWFAVGLKGEACLGVWTYDGIDVTLRNSLIPQRSNHFEVPGFTVSKIVSLADRATNKQAQSKKQKKEKQRKETVPDSSSLPDNAADTSSC
ncbi:hypothetical protein C5167_031602 [Papaver somniferum]|uniref:G domain-containing protein n=1 Tax=Papaver somniferum TaxID=3469 RepID=A0A4Y7K8T8_PAPSO|nr:hypothetical protein C5167_031602 [Papaver somniferum]